MWLMGKNYKICIIGAAHWSAARGGIEYQVKLIIDKLKKQKNIDLYFVTHNCADGYKPNGYNIVQLKIKKELHRFATFFGVLELYRILRTINPDIIYQNGSSALISAAAWYSKYYNCKLIWHVASDSNVVSKRKFSLLRHAHKIMDKKLFKYGVGHAHHIIVQTNYQKKLIRSLNNKAIISLVRNFHPFPEEIPMKNKKNQIIWVANFKLLKQPELFIDLSETLNEKRIGVNCIMIGAPASTPQSYQEILVKRINKIPNLVWLNQQPIQIVNKYINESKLFINTSKWEGFPNTYIQAWMRETPVVALTCDPDNIIKEHQIGMHSESYPKLVDDVIALLQNDKKRISIGRKAKKYSFKNHSLINLDRLIEILLQKN